MRRKSPMHGDGQRVETDSKQMQRVTARMREDEGWMQ